MKITVKIETQEDVMEALTRISELTAGIEKFQEKHGITNEENAKLFEEITQAWERYGELARLPRLPVK